MLDKIVTAVHKFTYTSSIWSTRLPHHYLKKEKCGLHLKQKHFLWKIIVKQWGLIRHHGTVKVCVICPRLISDNWSFFLSFLYPVRSGSLFSSTEIHLVEYWTLERREYLLASVEACANWLSIRIIEAIERYLTSPAVHETTVEFVAQYLASYYHLGMCGNLWEKSIYVLGVCSVCRLL